MGAEFFDLLYADPPFCEAVGRMMLAASRLESLLHMYALREGSSLPEHRATLGKLTGELATLGVLSENGRTVLELMATQRNYLSHKLYDLFTERIEETRLPRTDLVDGDVSMFTDYAWQLAENLKGLAAIVEERLGAEAGGEVL